MKKDELKKKNSEMTSRYLSISKMNSQDALKSLDSQINGLSEDQIEEHIKNYGENVLSKKASKP